MRGRSVVLRGVVWMRVRGGGRGRREHSLDLHLLVFVQLVAHTDTDTVDCQLGTITEQSGAGCTIPLPLLTLSCHSLSPISLPLLPIAHCRHTGAADVDDAHAIHQ